MAHPRLIPLRTPLLLAATVVALAASSVPAYAGGDECGGSSAPEADDSSLRLRLGGEDCPPAPAPARPVVPGQPAPARPAPARPAPARPAPAVRTPPVQQPVQSRVRPVQTRQVVPRRTFVQGGQAVPRGGVQTGAGGTARVLPSATRPSPALAVAALLLGLLCLGGGLRAVHVGSRR